MALNWKIFTQRPYIKSLSLEEQVRLFNIANEKSIKLREQQFTDFANSNSTSQGAAGDGKETASSTTLLLDEYGDNSFMAASMRKLRSDYTGFALRVQRNGTNSGTSSTTDQADVSFDSEGKVSLDSPITAVSAGVNSTTLGEFVAATGYTDPDGLGSGCNANSYRVYNQVPDANILDGDTNYFTGQASEVVVNGALWTVTVGGTEFPAFRMTWRETFLNNSHFPLSVTNRTHFTVVEYAAGGYTEEDVSLSTRRYNSEREVVRYNDSAGTTKLVTSTRADLITSSNTFANGSVNVAGVLLQVAPNETAYWINNNKQGSVTNYDPETEYGNVSYWQYDQVAFDHNVKTDGPDPLEFIFYNDGLSTSAIEGINQNIMAYYNIT